ncbi:MAG: hypothetical protein QOD33_1091 [Pyrinomonadaceae bacterium]|nr:hypothetical protein [Pyrinomonadaceae bacterium]
MRFSPNTAGPTMTAGFAGASGRRHPRRPGARLLFLLGVSVWIALVATGLGWLWRYENAPGRAATAPATWPANSRIQLAQNEPTLVMLVHPRCPCTRASIGELARIMAHSQGRVRAYVLFLKPDGTSDDWETTDLWDSVANIPGVNAVRDSGGAEARLFDGATSGQTFLYDPLGRLLFSGGITQARGHFGDNAGESAIVAILNAETPDRTETSVFGCPLFNPESECKVAIDGKHKY